MKNLILQPFNVVVSVLRAIPKTLKPLYVTLLLLGLPDFFAKIIFFGLLKPSAADSSAGLENQDIYLRVLLLSQLVQLVLIILIEPLLQGLKIILIAQTDSNQSINISNACKTVIHYRNALLGLGILKGLFELPGRLLFFYMMSVIQQSENIVTIIAGWLLAVVTPWLTLIDSPSLLSDLLAVLRVAGLLGVIVSVWLFVIPYQIVLRHQSLIPAIKSSTYIFRRHWLLMLVVIQLYSALIVTLPLFIAKSVSTALTTTLLIQPVMRLLIEPIKQIADVLFYQRISLEQISLLPEKS